MFFESKTRWGGKFQLSRLFNEDPGAPAQRDKVSAVLKTLQEARNEIAHYRPFRFPTFELPLYSAATLARWFGRDLQHIYGSIDTRESTELSVLLRATAQYATWRDAAGAATCETAGCAAGAPIDILMESAPREHLELATVKFSRACLYHRVQKRVALHRPVSASQPG